MKPIGFEIYSDFRYENLVARIAKASGSVLKDPIEPGLISEISLTPVESRVQTKTDIVLKFKTLNYLANPADIEIKFPDRITLPKIDCEVPGADAQDDEKACVYLQPLNSIRVYFAATKGRLTGGNVVKIDDVFGGRDLPFEKEIVFELQFRSLKNPFSVRPAGEIIISTFRGGFMVDRGSTAKTYTPTPGLVDGRQIFVSDAMTNGVSSTYRLIFVPESIIPATGLIQIEFPP